jgi:hypothetical protein
MIGKGQRKLIGIKDVILAALHTGVHNRLDISALDCPQAYRPDIDGVCSLK